jgi:histidinol-phosphatase (PHP family)
MVPYNFHTHSNYSDGNSPIEEYIIEAINQKFEGIGISEHSVLPFQNTFALQQEKESLYVSELDSLKEKYKGCINIYKALESDFITGITESFELQKTRLGLDYIIGSVHLILPPEYKGEFNVDHLWFIDGPKRETYDNGLNLLFGGDAKKAVTAYWHQINTMVETEQFDLVGHLDKIKMHNQGRWFDEESPWYINLWKESTELIAQKNLLVEINTRGLYKKRSSSLFPGKNILKELRKLNVGIVLSSDAHAPNEISLFFEEALRTLKECGYSSTWVFTPYGWTERSFS